jgi:DNA repair protein RecO (recombination protein O)
MSLYRDEGVVLRTYRLGEADRIVVLLTRGRGKVRAVAKGIRKTKSKFGARLEPGGHVNLLMYEGRELDIINQAETVDHYRALREDLERMTDAMALLEAVDQVAQEGEPNAALFRMLTGALKTLGEADQRPVLLVASFYWKLLALEGVSPMLDGCVVCASEATTEGPAADGELVAFDFVEGGALCRRHRRGATIDPEALSLIQRILGGGLAGVLAEPPSPAAATVSGLATTALETHLERRLRAVHLLGH